MIKYDQPVTNGELIEYLKTLPQDELAWIGGTHNSIYIGKDTIYDRNGSTEYEFLYDTDFITPRKESLQHNENNDSIDPF